MLTKSGIMFHVLILAIRASVGWREGIEDQDSPG